MREGTLINGTPQSPELDDMTKVSQKDSTADTTGTQGKGDTLLMMRKVQTSDPALQLAEQRDVAN